MRQAHIARDVIKLVCFIKIKMATNYLKEHLVKMEHFVKSSLFSSLK